jgi:hypothetical protein
MFLQSVLKLLFLLTFSVKFVLFYADSGYFGFSLITDSESDDSNIPPACCTCLHPNAHRATPTRIFLLQGLLNRVKSFEIQASSFKVGVMCDSSFQTDFFQNLLILIIDISGCLKQPRPLLRDQRYSRSRPLRLPARLLLSLRSCRIPYRRRH